MLREAADFPFERGTTMRITWLLVLGLGFVWVSCGDSSGGDLFTPTGTGSTVGSGGTGTAGATTVTGAGGSATVGAGGAGTTSGTAGSGTTTGGGAAGS